MIQNIYKTYLNAECTLFPINGISIRRKLLQNTEIKICVNRGILYLKPDDKDFEIGESLVH